VSRKIDPRGRSRTALRSTDDPTQLSVLNPMLTIVAGSSGIVETLFPELGSWAPTSALPRDSLRLCQNN